MGGVKYTLPILVLRKPDDLRYLKVGLRTLPVVLCLAVA